MIASTIILGIGHIGIHINHQKEIINKPVKIKPWKFVIRLITSLVAFIFIVANVFVLTISV